MTYQEIAAHLNINNMQTAAFVEIQDEVVEIMSPQGEMTDDQFSRLVERADVIVLKYLEEHGA